jgi:hypothetical protein
LPYLFSDADFGSGSAEIVVRFSPGVVIERAILVETECGDVSLVDDRHARSSRLRRRIARVGQTVARALSVSRPIIQSSPLTVAAVDLFGIMTKGGSIRIAPLAV